MNKKNKKESFAQKSFSLMVAGVIGAGLFGAWLIQYAQPINSAKSELAKVKAEIALSKAELLEAKIAQKEYELSNEIKTLIKEKVSLSDQVVNLKKIKNETLKQSLEDQKKLMKSLSEYKKLLSDAKKKESQKNGDEQIKKAESLIEFTEIEIASNQSDLDAWQEDLEKKFANAQNLLKEINQKSLSGIWHQSGSSIEGHDVYVEFLNGGKLRTYFGNQAVIFSNQKWFTKNNYLFIESVQEGEDKPISNGRGILIEGKLEFANVGELIFENYPFIRISELEAKEIRKNIPKKNWVQKIFSPK